MNVLQLSGLLIAGDAAFAASIWAVTLFHETAKRAARSSRVWEKYLRGETVTLDAFVAKRGLRVRETRSSLMPPARALPRATQTATNDVHGKQGNVLAAATGNVLATAPALDPRLRDALVAMGFKTGQVNAVLRGMGRETGTGTDFQAQIKTALGRLAK
jgi:hypothetical protein